MKRAAFFYFLFPLFIVSICGCVALVVGGAVGALGGYAISKDTIRADSDKSFEQLWSAALDVSKMRGVIRHEDSVTGQIEADIEKTKVRIHIVRLTRSITRIKISCRRYNLPNLELAQDLFVKIIEEAK